MDHSRPTLDHASEITSCVLYLFSWREHEKGGVLRNFLSQICSIAFVANSPEWHQCAANCAVQSKLLSIWFSVSVEDVHHPGLRAPPSCLVKAYRLKPCTRK